MFLQVFLWEFLFAFVFWWMLGDCGFDLFSPLWDEFSGYRGFEGINWRQCGFLWLGAFAEMASRAHKPNEDICFIDGRGRFIFLIGEQARSHDETAMAFTFVGFVFLRLWSGAALGRRGFSLLSFTLLYMREDFQRIFWKCFCFAVSLHAEYFARMFARGKRPMGRDLE